MSEANSERLDRWAEWVLSRGHGGDERGARRKLELLQPVKSKVLENAAVQPGDVVLDVGTGDGLIGFGALDLLGDSGRVIFSDISTELVSVCRETASALGVAERCDFAVASADDLSRFPDGSVDVVTTRSVVIYLPLQRKRTVFREFYRVLRNGGRLSMFEPINSRFKTLGEAEVWGYDVSAVSDLAQRVVAAYGQQDSALVDFDDRDLGGFAEDAGFGDIGLDLQVRIEREPWFEDWESFLKTAGNPLIPTQEEAIREALSEQEAERFRDHLRPLVEQKKGTRRSAVVYLWCTK
ncbi:MAG TPA: class I SAM-dependent methyltransferase [Actinomycetota bacterium]|nr:class I SAM-dependent methyltransferase [Actinomycetota bacterium]